MKFKKVVKTCHVRSAIYREGDKYFISQGGVAPNGVPHSPKGTKVRKLYAKNHTIPLEERVPKKDQLHDDWEEYDPRDYDPCSLPFD